MKICILTPRFPFPENGGDVLRINAISRYLKENGHTLILCSFYTNIEDSYLEQAHELFDKIYITKFNKILSLFNCFIAFVSNKPIQCGYYKSFKYSKLFKKIIKNEKCDLYISHLLRMVPYLEANNLFSNSIVEMTDALSKTYSLSCNSNFSLKQFIYRLEKNRIKKYESDVIQKFKKIVLVSQSDIDYLGKNSNLCLHTNGINCSNLNSVINKNKICFVGNMRTLQNQDAVMFFVKTIFPIIKKTIPSAEFHIVGAQPSESIVRLADQRNIFVTGFVDSVEDYIKDACVLVAPVKIAAGIQNKVLIGMACHIPVVLTSLISKAIPELQDSKNCFIADKEDLFAEKCVELISNEDLREKIASAGFNVMKEFYSWEKTLNGYENVL